MKYRRYMLYGRKQERADALGAIAFWIPLTVLIGVILFACVGCGTTALKPEEKLVSSVTSLPPVQVPIAAPCVKPPGGCVGADPADKCQEMPVIPNVVIDPNATPLQRNYQKKEALLAAEIYYRDAQAALLGCAGKTPPEKK